MGSKTVVGSIKKSDSVKGVSRKKIDDDASQTSDSEMEDMSSDEGDSRITSTMDDDKTGSESVPGEEEEDSNEGEKGEEGMSDDKEDISGEEGTISEEEEDMSDEEDIGGEENMSDEEEENISDSDVSDSGELQRNREGYKVMDSGDGVELTDSDDNVSEEEHEDDKTEDGETNDVKVAANPAWAQALAKILRTQKPTGKKAVVLSKARTIPAAEAAAARKTDEPDFEIIAEGDVKPKLKVEDVKPTEQELILAKRQRLAYCRVKQEEFDFNRERALTKIATRGVVQLFNAVRAEQKTLGSRLATAHSTRMEEKLLKSIDKNSFLEHLTGKIKSQKVKDFEKKVKKEKDEAIALPKSWDELSKSVASGKDLHGWDRVVEIKDEPDD